jgi:gluconolactonase
MLAASACATSSSATPPGGDTSSPPGPDVFPGAGAPAPLASSIPFESLEGPLWLTAQNALLFSDVVEANGANARIYRYDGATQAIAPLPYPAKSPTSTNGLSVDASGRLVACERYNGRVVRVEPNGTLTVLADRWPAEGGKPLNAPNDVIVRADGNIYFSDPAWGTNKSVEHPPMGVYRIAPDGKLSRVFDTENPNGVALSPDGSKLYVSSDSLANVWVIPLDASGVPGAATLLIEGAKVAHGFKVPDGICVDDSGNLYIATNHDDTKAIVAFDPAGHTLGRIAMPFRSSNCTFGGPDRRTMYVTTLHAVYSIRMPTPGLP